MPKKFEIENEQTRQLVYRLFASENFLQLAIKHRFGAPGSEKSLKSLNTETQEAIHALTSLLPPPKSIWDEFAQSLQYPMSQRLADIKRCELEIIRLSDEKPLKLAELRKQERQRDTYVAALQTHIVEKKTQQDNLASLLTGRLAHNPAMQATLSETLTKIETCKARTQKYENLKKSATALADNCSWLGNGPFPISAIGQLLAPFPLLVTRYCHAAIQRHDPSSNAQSLSQAMDTVGVTAGVSAAILGVVTIASAPLLPVVAAGAVLINSITSTFTAAKNYKKAKGILESLEGKAMRIKGHVADVVGNVANVVASTGLLGIAVAVAIAVTTVAFPPATLAILGVAALGVSIAAMTVSAGAYLRKRSCLKQADDLKLFFDFENACQQGALGALNFGLDDQKLRSLASARYKSKPLDVPLRCAYLSSPSDSTQHAAQTMDPKETIKHFERVLNLGFVPKLVDTNGHSIQFPPHLRSEDRHIHITQLSPPNPLAAIQAIKQAGGIPDITDPKLQAQILNAYQSEHISHQDIHTYPALIKALFPAPDPNSISPVQLSQHPNTPITVQPAPSASSSAIKTQIELESTSTQPHPPMHHP